MSTEIGGKCITLYVSADHRRFRSKLHVWITWRWCSGWRQGQAAVRVGDVKAWPRCPWAVAGPGRANRPDAAGMERAASTIGPGRGARGRWRGLAGLRDDAPSDARGADGSRAGRRPRAHQAARHRPSSPAPQNRAYGARNTDRPQPMFHVKHLPIPRPRYPVSPGKWHT